MLRLGVLGNGVIAAAVAEFAHGRPGCELVFVQSRTAGTAPGGVAVTTTPPSDEVLRSVDVVVEAAHPDVVAAHGARILQHCDLMVVSSGALVDEALLDELEKTATGSGTRLIVPQGALVGLEAVRAQAGRWEDASITMVKAPEHLDPPPEHVTGRTVLHDGELGALVRQYPRNVNAMVTFALATLGVRRTRCRLVCDPGAERGRLEMSLRAADGTSLDIVKEQPMVGVSGSELPSSIVQSLSSATLSHAPGLLFI